MVEFVKSVIRWKLRLLSRLYLWLNKIEIIAITGSAGKTTTKVTLGQILPKKTIYVPKEAYNTEYGVPLALFDQKVPTNPKNLLAWVGLILRMTLKLFVPSGYKRIVLEYGADSVGDISYLTSFAHPHIAVVTTVLPVHLAGFGTIEAVATEKAKLVECLRVSDFAILNFDDPLVKKMAKSTQATVISFGQKSADILYTDLKFSEAGMSLDISWKGTKYALNIPVVAPQLLPSYLGAFAVALVLGEDPRELARKFTHITPEKGRMNVLQGLRGSTLIDDSYNSNPESAKAALAVLDKFTGHKIAVLGSMNELGDFTKEGHREVGETAGQIADEVVVIGDIAIEYLYPVVLAKLGAKAVKKFGTAREAGEYLATVIKKDDILLFKGSQNGVFAEEAVKCVLADQEKAGELLVRQGQMWQNKKGRL